MTTAVLEKTRTDIDLKVSDRCDRCGAQAFILAYMEECEGDMILLFCNHHAKNAKTKTGISHMQALESQGFVVLDFSDRLNEKPSPSASELD